MTKQEFLKRIEMEKPYLGAYEIETDILTDAAYVMGCIYDEGVWKIYKTTERDGYYIIDELADENEAFDEFYELVCSQAKMSAKRKPKGLS